jgi:hypothetical protein
MKTYTSPNLKKNINVLNIIVQNILEKIRCEGNGPQRNTQNSNAPNKLWNIKGMDETYELIQLPTRNTKLL